MNRFFLLSLAVVSLVACSDNPKGEGQALAKDYCAAVKQAQSDPMRAMELGQEFAKKAEAAAEKYADNPIKAQQLLSGYTANATSCLN